MFKKKIKEMQGNTKKQIENIVFFIIVLIVTMIVINCWTSNKNSSGKEENNINSKTLASLNEESSSNSDLEKNLENILKTVKGVGDVKVFINYSESGKTVALYDENTKTSTTEENDDSGGNRTITETDTEKSVVFSEKNGSKEPVTQKTVMPTIQGAVVSAKGASDAVVKTNIVNAVQAATGLTIDKIQVFEMK